MTLGLAAGHMHWFDRRSRAAIWGRRLAFFSLPVLILSILAYRTGMTDVRAAVVLYASAFGLALAGGILSIVALFRIWAIGHRGTGTALVGLFTCLLVLAVPAAFGLRAAGLPAINDVTTDPADPPPFIATASQRRATGAPLAYPGEEVATQQARAYPDIAPLRLEEPPSRAFELALATIEDTGWRIIAASPPANEMEEGSIEAVATTLVLGFQDDVVVRVRPDGDGALVDMRSASRLGVHDLGANAGRIRRFYAALTQKRDEEAAR
jgi:uncharacterized protein (DUF1499 family)